MKAPGPLADAQAPPTGFYRVLAMGLDGSGIARAVTESIVARPWLEGAELVNEPTRVNVFCQGVAANPCGRMAWRQLR